MRLEGKVAIVTGAGHGIGRGIAERFAREGARVAVNDVDPERAEEVAAAIGEARSRRPRTCPTRPRSTPCSTPRSSASARSTCSSNNAGLIDVERHVLEADEAWWDRVLDVNLKGQFLCALRAAKEMAPRRAGCMVNLSSGGARQAHRGMVSYDASKGGVEAMTRALALDLAPYGIRVNALAPGAINVMGLSEEEARRRGETVPMRRVGTPEDLAGPAVFLASDDAAYVTGVVISVDGGLLVQQRSPQVDIFPLSRFPGLEPG